MVGNNFYLAVYTESKKETEQLYNKLSAGGKIELPLQSTFRDAYFGIVKDKFGIHMDDQL